MSDKRRWMFALAWWFVIFVSVIDAYLLFYCRDVIGQYELNPAGNLLLAMGGGQVWLFLLLKFFGTILACMLLKVLYRHRPRVGLSIAMVLACLQLSLLMFLSYG